jgi:hypothetical protein
MMGILLSAWVSVGLTRRMQPCTTMPMLPGLMVDCHCTSGWLMHLQELWAAQGYSQTVNFKHRLRWLRWRQATSCCMARLSTSTWR